VIYLSFASSASGRSPASFAANAARSGSASYAESSWQNSPKASM
jgi:hypothetical protein